MNSYGRLAGIKSDMGIAGATQDAALLRLMDRIARAIDNETHRHFYNEFATRYYDGDGYAELWLPDDVLSVTTLKVDKDDDDVFETEVALTDYRLWPYNEAAKRRIDLLSNSASITTWPNYDHAIEITGEFGFSNETELTTTTLAEELDASETGVDVADGTAIDLGETIVVENEQMHVSAIATNTLTVVRGVNGTTAATHVTGLAVYRRRYPGPVEEAFMLQVARMLRAQETGASGEVGTEEVGGYSFSGLYPAIKDLLKPYSRLVVA